MWSSVTGILCLHIVAIVGSTYNSGDEVIIYVNKVGPYDNPHETYHYYKLPVCRPRIIEHKPLTLGEVLDGDLLAKSLYKVKFLETVSKSKLCDLILSPDEIFYLRNAIEDNYYFEFVVDEIPVRGFLGHFEEEGLVHHIHKVHLWTHQHFQFFYNDDHIIYVNLTEEHSPINLEESENPLTFSPTYSVSWVPTRILYEERDSVSRNTNFFPSSLEVHWISVINSSLLVFLLIGLVTVVLTRVLRKDFARYNLEDSENDDEYGWKLIHGDVFRIPEHIDLLSAILGIGVQLLVIGLVIISSALLGFFSVHRHATMTVLGIVLYAVTSLLSGSVSGAFYRKAGGTRWIRQFNLTALLFAGPVVVIWMIQNSVAWAYQSTQALPFGTALMIALLWAFVGYPATAIGSSISKIFGFEFDFPCRTKKFAREVPLNPWYKQSVLQYVIGGFLPFSAVSVEMHYIFSSMWGRENYYLFGILGLVFLIQLSVVVCVSITFTYFQLASEDYRWWWRSLFTCGSTSVYVLLYSAYFYFQQSSMSGGLQTIEFLGWSLLAAYVFFLVLGTVSFISSFIFVKYIYKNIKMD